MLNAITDQSGLEGFFEENNYEEVHISNYNFSGNLTFRTRNMIRVNTKKLVFQNCLFIQGQMTFKEIEREYLYIEFRNCKISTPIEFIGCILKNLRFETCQIQQIVFSNCAMESCEMYIQNLEVFRNARETKTLHQMLDETIGTHDSFAMTQATANKIELFNPGIQISNCKMALRIRGYNNLFLKNLSIWQLNSPFSSTSIEHIDIFEFGFGGSNPSANISFKYLNVATFSVKNFYNQGVFTIFNVACLKEFRGSTHALFQCVQSNLGKAFFLRVNFRSYRFVDFEDSALVECLFTNSIWSSSRRPITRDKFMSIHKGVIRIKSPEKLREIFRQLKFAQSKGGDTIWEKRFYAMEMTEYLGYTSNGKLWKDWIVLYLSKVTSDFGNSWIRPIFFILITSAMLFPIYFHTLNFDPNADCCQTLPLVERASVLVKEWIKFCLPIRTIDFDLPLLSLLCDLLMRLVSSYGIYNFIRATRQFVK